MIKSAAIKLLFGLTLQGNVLVVPHVTSSQERLQQDVAVCYAIAQGELNNSPISRVDHINDSFDIVEAKAYHGCHNWNFYKSDSE